MGQGLIKSGYFIFIEKGETFQSIYGEGLVTKHYFKRCIILNGEIITKELERYQMYVPINDGRFNFKENKIYNLSEVSHGAAKEDISGTINLSHQISPIELSYEEFKQEWKKIRVGKLLIHPS